MWEHEAGTFGISMHLIVCLCVCVNWVNVLLIIRVGDVRWEEPKVRRWRRMQGTAKPLISPPFPVDGSGLKAPSVRRIFVLGPGNSSPCPALK